MNGPRVSTENIRTKNKYLITLQILDGLRENISSAKII